MDPYLALLPLTLGFFALGYAVQRLIIGPASHGDDGNILLITLGLAIIIANAMLAVFRSDTRSVDVAYAFSVVEVGGFFLSLPRLLAVAVVIAVALLLWLFLARSQTGAPVLRGVSLAVAEGEIITVLGANGLGKTTLNRTLSGLVRASSGTIRFLGERIDRLAPSDIVRRGLIHVPEGRRIFPNLTVRENLLLGAYARGRERRAATLDRVFATFPRLAERTRQLAGTLSGGEQQMLAIGRGLTAEPRLLVLDEPSLGLSPLLVEEMFGLIARIAADGLAVLLVEQNVVQSLALAARAYVLENGTVVMEGPAGALAADPALASADLGL